MSLRVDVNRLINAMDSGMIMFVTSSDMETETGVRLATAVMDLHKRYFEASMLCHRLALVEAEVDGLRTTNEMLTTLLEEQV